MDINVVDQMISVNLIDMWTNLLPIANLLFAVVFAIVIFSTATGQGLTNYSIKKILPRLVIVAIGVNVSFYLCAILADVINIVAVGIPDLVFSTDWRGTTEGMADTVLAENALGGFVGVVVLACMGLVTAVAVIVTVLALAARQILLSMLVIISPLAIACAVLPATQKMFEKWAQTYVQLLAVYPLFMLIYAGSRWFQLSIEGLANPDSGAIINNALVFMVKVIAPIIPAVAIYPLLKMSGGVMGKITGAIDKSPLGTQGALGKAAQESDKYRRQGVGNVVREFGVRRDRKINQADDEVKNAKNNLDVATTRAQDDYAKTYAKLDADGNIRKDDQGKYILQDNVDRAVFEMGLNDATNNDRDVQLARDRLSNAEGAASSMGFARFRRNVGGVMNSRTRRARSDMRKQSGQREKDAQAAVGMPFGGSTYGRRYAASAQQELDEQSVKDQNAAEILKRSEMGGAWLNPKEITKEYQKALDAGDSDMVIALTKQLSIIGNVKEQRDMMINISRNTKLSVAERQKIIENAANSDLFKTGTIGGTLRGQLAAGLIQGSDEEALKMFTQSQVSKLAELKDDTMKGLDDDMFNELRRVAGNDPNQTAKIQNAIYKLYENKGSMTEKAIKAATDAGYTVPGGPVPVQGPIAPTT